MGFIDYSLADADHQSWTADVDKTVSEILTLSVESFIWSEEN